MLAYALLLVAAAAAQSGPQAPAGGWDVLARAAEDADTPSTEAERARSPLPADPSRVVYLVRPHDTDPKISHFLKDHYVMYDRAVAQNGRLFVFLPGTWARPAQYQLLLNETAHAGYKAIGLEYPDASPDPKASAVVQICASNPDPNCPAQVRTARIWGGTANGVAVAPADGIDSRLKHLLAYLVRAHPSDGWSQFLVEGRVGWSGVALGGHSQGAGMAAFLAKRIAVARVALWSGPAEYVPATHSLAPWLSGPSATPHERWYAVVHGDEAGERVFLAAYAALGVPGTPAVADAAVPSGTQQFVVTLPPRTGKGPEMPAIVSPQHGSVASDARTPLSPDGRPVYAALWRAMIGP